MEPTKNVINQRAGFTPNDCIVAAVMPFTRKPLPWGHNSVRTSYLREKHSDISVSAKTAPLAPAQITGGLS